MEKQKENFDIESNFSFTATGNEKVKSSHYISRVIKILIILLVGLFFFINFIKVINKSNNNLYLVFRNFSSEVFSKGPTGFLYDWFTIKKGDAIFSKKEGMVFYQLNLLTKMLNGYFENLLLKTDRLVGKFKNNDFISFIKKGKFSKQYYYNAVRKDIKNYLLKNKDVIASYLYTLDGRVVTGAKYQNIKAINLSQEMIAKTISNKNVLLKYGKYVLLLSSVTYQNQPTTVFCQMLNPIFFSQILAGLEINKNIFYLKDKNNEVLIHNYEAQQYVSANQNKIISDLFYRSLTKNKEQELEIEINEMDFKVASIIRENNFWGYTVSLIFFIAMLYCSIYFVNFIFNKVKSFIAKKKNDNILKI